MPTEMLATRATRALRRLVARGPARRIGWRGVPGLPRLGRLMGQARAACRGRSDRHGRPPSLARGPDPGASALGETPVAALVDRRLMVLTGRRDEWVIRLPGAFSALATVALIYLLGRRIGGRAGGTGLGLGPLFVGVLRGEMRRPATTGRSLCSPRWRVCGLAPAPRRQTTTLADQPATAIARRAGILEPGPVRGAGAGDS